MKLHLGKVGGRLVIDVRLSASEYRSLRAKVSVAPTRRLQASSTDGTLFMLAVEPDAEHRTAPVPAERAELDAFSPTSSTITAMRTAMDRADTVRRRRDLDRRVLQLAANYMDLGDRVAGEAVTNPHLNPSGSVTDALFGMAGACANWHADGRRRRAPLLPCTSSSARATRRS